MPVYNQQDYIGKMLESIKAQIFADFELIIVDDGSTDNSLRIIRDFCKDNDNFKYIHKANGGVSSARQAGLDIAKGEYIIQVDSDDWLEPDYLLKLYTKAQETNADIVICNYIKEYPDRRDLVDVPEHITSVGELKLALANGSVWGTLWNKLIKSSCVKNITFEQGINFQEDLLFVYRVLSRVSRIAFVDDYLYHYNRCNQSSAINSQSISTLFQAWRVKELVLKSEPDIQFRNQIGEEMISVTMLTQLLYRKDLSLTQYFSLTKPLNHVIRRKCKNNIHRQAVKPRLSKAQTGRSTMGGGRIMLYSILVLVTLNMARIYHSLVREKRQN